MSTTARILRYAVLALLALAAVGAGLFGAGSAFTDLPPVTAALLTLAWVVPLVGLSVLAWHRPDEMVLWLALAVLLVLTFGRVEPFLDLVPESFGPVVAMATVAVLVPLGVLGVHRALPAGLLLATLGLVPVLGMVVGLARGGHAGELGHALPRWVGTPGGLLAVLALVAGAVLLLAAALVRERLVPHAGARTRPAA